MCRFFSFCSEDGKPLYFNAEQRRKILKNEGEFKGLHYYVDSHTSIADYFGYKDEREDELNKYEYNPLTKEFKVDYLGNKDDSKQMKKWVKTLDFKTIVPELIIKPILNPFEVEPPKDLTKAKKLLKQWISVLDSVENSVEDSVEDSVWDSIKNSVGTSVGNSAWNSVWDSVWDSVRGSVWHSVWDSIWDLIWAYISSFFDIKYDYDFSPAVKLWEMGLVSYAVSFGI